MWRRLYFPLVALFWVIMNVLLWRSEMGDPTGLGQPLAVEAVWDRILTAPDESPLVIYQKDRRVGRCRWLPTVGEEMPAASAEGTEFAPEGRVDRITGYRLDFDGTLRWGENPGPPWRFHWEIEFDPDKRWKTIRLELTRRPARWEVSTDAATEQVTLRVGDGPEAWTRTFDPEELRSPAAILRKLGLPAPLGGWVASMGQWMPAGRAGWRLDLQWEAYQDWIRLAHARTRVYRLRARLFEDQYIEVLLSRVGEILKVELPGDIRLLNEGFTWGR
ncbi:MAG: hypothetical protein D6766_09650 [Verrucomicrobia bacterium]|nr:MAG: hypothetical protein D6766_09650 [Verrucomicrobiota bacterium]